LFVAMHDGKPVGRVGYLQVGDIARLSELFVLSESRRIGVGRAMATRFLQLARRLLPQAIVACSDIDDAPSAAFLGAMGFTPAGELEHFER
jgi:GNAT superfamily N-acetyltransferase